MYPYHDLVQLRAAACSIPAGSDSACVFCLCHLFLPSAGSGKTYQMGGAASLQQDLSSNNSAAVLPQACAQLLDYIAGARDVYDVQLKVG